MRGFDPTLRLPVDVNLRQHIFMSVTAPWAFGV